MSRRVSRENLLRARKLLNRGRMGDHRIPLVVGEQDARITLDHLDLDLFDAEEDTSPGSSSESRV